MNKKGIELPISMIIVLILSIMVFSFGTVMIFKFYKGATDASTAIDAATQEQIMAVLREGNDLVALPKNTADARVGQSVVFGLGIRNIGERRRFTTRIGFSGAYDLNEASFTNTDTSLIENTWLGSFKEQKDILIDKDTFFMLPITLRVGNSVAQDLPTKPGTYVFNICVFPAGQATDTTDCVLQNKESTYDKKIHQINIRVR